MDKIVDDTVVKAKRAIDAVLNNQLPMPRCPREKERCIELREKVKKELSVQMGAVGPAQIK